MLGQISMNNQIIKQFGAADTLDTRAASLFEKALRAPGGSILQKLLGRTVEPLMLLNAVVEQARIANRYAAGSKTVALSQIRGTMDRCGDFDSEFHPIQRHSENRWVKVATAMLRGAHLPPVELIQVRDTYYVKDGHHRISVACALGYGYIDAVVEVIETA